MPCAWPGCVRTDAVRVHELPAQPQPVWGAVFSAGRHRDTMSEKPLRLGSVTPTQDLHLESSERQLLPSSVASQGGPEARHSAPPTLLSSR